MTRNRTRKKASEEELDDRLFRFCVTLHPPDKDYPVDNLEDYRAYYADVELTSKEHKEAEMLMGMRRGSYHRDKNPVYAIEAFLIAHQAGLYPPIWVLEFLYDAFIDFHESNGSKSIDKLLGFTRDRGQSKPFQAVMNRDRDQMLMIHMGRLIAVYGISVEDAAHMVCRRLEEMPEEDFKFVKKLSADTIKDKYLRKWKDIVGPQSGMSARHFGDWDDDKKREYLKNYPEDAIPKDLKKLLK